MKENDRDSGLSPDSPKGSALAGCCDAGETGGTLEVDRRHPNACAPVECSGEHASAPVKHGDHVDFHVGHAHHHRHGDHCDLHGCC